MLVAIGSLRAGSNVPRRALVVATLLLCMAAAALTVASGPEAAAVGITVPSAGTPGPVPAAAQAYNYSPSSRYLSPVAVKSTRGNVSDPEGGIGDKSGFVKLTGTGASVTYDFGKEVGGRAGLTFFGPADTTQQLGVSYSESSLYAGGTTSDLSGGGSEASDFPMQGANYPFMRVDSAQQRGGFRYLTLFLRTNGSVTFLDVDVAITFAPTMGTPNAYPNYFLSNDPLLNRIWYAGAYTVQTNTLKPSEGRQYPPPATGWNNNAQIADGSSVLADGAKRDRTVWPGDLGISLPTQYVSTNDLISTKNALQAMYDMERTTLEWIDGGVKTEYELPFAGQPVNSFGSDTYHMWTLLGTSTYLRYSDDAAFASSIWSKYQQGLQYVADRLDHSDLFSVGHGDDWGRSIATSGESLEASALAYGVLRGAAFVARTYRNDSGAATAYDTKADALRAAINANMFDPARGLYRETPTTAVYPQDGNSLALWFGIPANQVIRAWVTKSLRSMFTQYGAPTPERVGAISTFPGSMEVHGLFAAHDPSAALDLIRREWGYMLDSPNGTRSTFWEGFKTDGSFDYSGSYMSASHGWATGPTAALTFYVLGLQPDGHSQFRFVPQPGDLTSASGRLTLPGGVADASWTRDPVTGRFTAQVSAYAATTISQIAVPKHGNANMRISVNGSDVWRFGPVSGSPYLVSEDSDAFYISAPTGALPSGRYDVVAQPDATWDSSYKVCASEGGPCSVSGSRVVAYGVSEHWVYRWVTGTVQCSPDGFGSDPAFGVVKKCFAAPGGSARYDLPEAGPSGYTWCAFEYSACAFTGAHVVAFGGNGSFSYRTLTSGTPCTQAVFGRSGPAAARADCYVADSRLGGDWYRCSGEGGRCPATLGPIWYGANGIYAVVDPSRSTTCGAATMGGDPLPGVTKACFVYYPPDVP
jgi:alpha-L-rhamnosidase-like protein